MHVDRFLLSEPSQYLLCDLLVHQCLSISLTPPPSHTPHTSLHS